jgi:hypothetical protein
MRKPGLVGRAATGLMAWMAVARAREILWRYGLGPRPLTGWLTKPLLENLSLVSGWARNWLGIEIDHKVLYDAQHPQL